MSDSSVLEKVKLGFAIPDIPAFKALGLDPSNILRPSEAKQLALTVGSFRNEGNFIIPKNYIRKPGAMQTNYNLCTVK